MKIANPALFCLLLSLTASGFALESDRSKPLKVQADRASLQKKSGISTYSGHVIVQQGSLIIKADQLTVYTRDGKLLKMVAQGSPAGFQQRPDNKKQDITAKALKMTFNARENTTIFEQQAELRQGKNAFKSNRIVYNLSKDTVIAGKQNGGGRVTITIQTDKPASKPVSTPPAAPSDSPKNIPE